MFVLIPCACPAADVLETAKQIANTRFENWTYGSDASRRQIDCVQFVLAVAEEELLQTLNATTRTQILISNLTEDERRELPQLIESESDKVKGIQHALVSMGRGRVVEPKDARAGDFVQYWMKQSDGTWFGHAGIIETVEKVSESYEATIFGAHKSTNRIATSDFKLRLTGPGRRVFIVRAK